MDIADLWVALTVLAFFGVCVAFVRGCDRFIGPDDAQDLVDAQLLEESSAEVGVR